MAVLLPMLLLPYASADDLLLDARLLLFAIHGWLLLLALPRFLLTSFRLVLVFVILLVSLLVISGLLVVLRSICLALRGARPWSGVAIVARVVRILYAVPVAIAETRRPGIEVHVTRFVLRRFARTSRIARARLPPFASNQCLREH